MAKDKNYTIQSFPLSRIFTMDVGRIGLQKHHVKGLIEIDVTDAQKKIKLIREKKGNTVSFTSWLVKCISQAVSENKQVHALKKGKNKLVIFNDIDISLIVEKIVEGTPVPIPMVIRNADKKNLNEIYSEIEKAKSLEVKNEKDYVIERNRNNKYLKLFSLLPRSLRLLIWKILLSDPNRIKKMMGTALISSLGMMGNVHGWFIPYSIHPVCFAVGPIVKKPGIINNTVTVRDFLCMTILIDHDVVDGAPAARFASRLSELMENSYGL